MSVVLSVLHSPKKTFEYIRDHGGAFLIPFLLLVAVTLAVAFLQIPVVEKALDMAGLEEAAGAIDMETLKKISVISSIVMTPIMVAASVFIIGLLLLLVNLIVRGEAKYMDLVKVAVLASIPNLINGILTGILARTTDVGNMNELSISLGAFMEQKEGFLFGLANLVNPFGIWGLALMVIGTAVMARRASSSVGIWIVGGYLLISIPLALLV